MAVMVNSCPGFPTFTTRTDAITQVRQVNLVHRLIGIALTAFDHRNLRSQDLSKTIRIGTVKIHERINAVALVADWLNSGLRAKYW